MKKYIILFALISLAFVSSNFSNAAKPSDFGLKEGDLISAIFSDDPDVYIVNEHGYKRLFLNPEIFKFYTHLGGFANIKLVTPEIRDSFPTVGFFRNCEDNDQKVYGTSVEGEDTGRLHWINKSGDQAVQEDPEFFRKVFCINRKEFNWYPRGNEFKELKEVPRYHRTEETAQYIICHRPTPEVFETIRVAEEALDAHFQHGDTKGACPTYVLPTFTPKPVPTEVPIFTQTPRPTYLPLNLKLISPNGGEKWNIGNKYEVTWEHPESIPGVKIELYKGGSYLSGLGGIGAGLYNRLESFPSWTWDTIDTPNFTPGSDFKMRVVSDYSFRNSSATGPTIYDESDNYFTVSGPNYPVTCDGLKSNPAYTRYFNSCAEEGRYDYVCFNKNYGTYQGCVSREYNGCTVNNTNASQNMACPVGPTVSPMPTPTPTPTLTLTPVPASTYITVVSPNGGETWQKGTTQMIKWNSSNVSKIYIKLRKGNDTYDGPGGFTTAIIPNDGYFKLTPSTELPDGNDYFIRVIDGNFTGIFDDGDKPFSLVSAWTPTYSPTPTPTPTPTSTSTSTTDFDLAVVDVIPSPAIPEANKDFTVDVVFKNVGQKSITNPTAGLSIYDSNGKNIYSPATGYISIINPGATFTVKFHSDLFSPRLPEATLNYPAGIYKMIGNINYLGTVDGINYAKDPYPNNDTFTKTLEIKSSAVSSPTPTVTLLPAPTSVTIGWYKGFSGQPPVGTYQMAVSFLYSGNVSDVQSFRLYLKKPGESSFSAVATFTGPSSISSTCSGDIYSGEWKIRNCTSSGGGYWQIFGPLMQSSSHPSGEYNAYLVALNNSGAESVASAIPKNIVSKTAILSPVGVQNSLTPQFKWSVPSNWPGGYFWPQVSDSTGNFIWNKAVYSGAGTTEGSTTYDGPTLSTSKTYYMNIWAEGNDSSGARYFSMGDSSPSFTISASSAVQSNFYRNLTLGSTGDDVKQLQALLVNEVGYSADLITGYFGRITRDAVKRLQEKYGVKPISGYFGAITRKALNALISN